MNDALSEALAEKMSVPLNVARMTIEPLAGAVQFCAALSDWIGGDAVPQLTVYDYSARMLMDDFGIPAFSALLLLGWLEENPEQLLPYFAEGYAALRDCPLRPATADPQAIARRVAAEAGVFSDGSMIGYEVLACVPDLQVAFWNWWESGQLPELQFEGFSAHGLMQPAPGKRPGHPVQALLSLDWLIKEPDRARAFLSTE